jgi:hypothetical protein
LKLFTAQTKKYDALLYRKYGENVSKNILDYDSNIRIGAELYVPKEVYSKL